MLAPQQAASASLSRMGREIGEPVISGLMARALAQPDLLSLGAGFTDNRVLPGALIREAMNALAESDPEQDSFQYGTTRGRAGLRAEVLRFLSTYPGEQMGLSADDVVITNGSQQFLYLLVQALCEPGDIILVESPTYFVFLDLLRGLGVRAVDLPQQADGTFDLDALADRLKEGDRERIKAVYLVTYFANPTGRCTPLSEKRRLGAFLSENAPSLTVIEDGAYRDMHYREVPDAPSVLSLPEYEGLPLAYGGTFSKAFSSGLKLGFGICPEPRLREAMVRMKAHHDFGSSNLLQAIVEWVFANERYAPHLESIQPHYQRKMQALVDALENAGLAEMGWTWEHPKGGLLLWADCPERLDTSIGSSFCERALASGVLYVPGDLCRANGSPKNGMRLSVGGIDETRMGEAVERLARAARSLDV